jgi:hypothetical protein
MTAIEIVDRLKVLAPNVAFGVSRKIDGYDKWDGDGEDPREEGYEGYSVTVKAVAIEDGKIIEGIDSLGSCYMKPDEEIGDVHGYLLQMLQQAATELSENANGGEIEDQLDAALGFLKQEMRNR